MMITVFAIAALVMSAIFHEFAHGWAAYKLGDPTAKYAGRLTLNPKNHLDPIGSIILPLFFVLSGSPVFLAWAKPVPYNPNNLRDKDYGELKVALAGPLSNLILATTFAIIARVLPLVTTLKYNLFVSFFNGDSNFLLNSMRGDILVSFFVMSIIIVFVNLALMIFNMIPFPPLDGSKVMMAFLPFEWQVKVRKLEHYGILFLFLFLMSGASTIIGTILIFTFRILVGV